MAKSVVTSVDVAQLANVSQSAVSRTFTPGASVSPKTRERVIAAAKELGYRPNVLARSLISGQSKIIGLVVAYLENHFYPIVIEKLSRELQSKGYHVLLFMAQTGKQDEVIQQILQYQIDGVILASVTLSSHIAEECANMGVPVVLLNRHVLTSDDHTSSVISDNRAGGRKAAELLVQTGHERIAFIAGDENASTNFEREKGFVESLTAAGTDIWKRGVGNYKFKDAQHAAREMIQSNEYPDAIFVANDHMAFAVMDVIRAEFNLRIPEDIAIIGYDDVPEAAWEGYSLTTIKQPIDDMIAATTKILLKQIEEKEINPVQEVLDTELIRRRSTPNTF